MAASTKPTDRLSRAALALAHPIRRSIIESIAEGVDTPNDIAVRIGEPLGVVSYHCRMLRDYEVIALDRTEPRRGALQHFYGFAEDAYPALLALHEASYAYAKGLLQRNLRDAAPEIAA